MLTERASWLFNGPNGVLWRSKSMSTPVLTGLAVRRRAWAGAGRGTRTGTGTAARAGAAAATRGADCPTGRASATLAGEMMSAVRDGRRGL